MEILKKLLQWDCILKYWNKYLKVFIKVSLSFSWRIWGSLPNKRPWYISISFKRLWHFIVKSQNFKINFLALPSDYYLIQGRGMLVSVPFLSTILAKIWTNGMFKLIPPKRIHHKNISLRKRNMYLCRKFKR
jgi:hypothetical protein